MLSRIVGRSKHQQMRTLVLGKIDPIPMPKEVAALRLALYRRDLHLRKQADNYEATCPPFEASNMLQGLSQILLATKAQKEDAAMLTGLLEAEPKTVSSAVVYNKDTYNIGLRALRKVGDLDSEMSWVVGHYLTRTISWYHLVGQGLYVVVRKRWLFLTCVLLIAIAVGYAGQQVTHEIIENHQPLLAAESPKVDLIALEKSRRKASRDATLSYAAPVAIATMIFGYPGTAAVGAASFVGLLINSVVPEEPTG
eukprot:TRINITY_DN30973_c0_g1_i1.p1 TRINITY_DN30973_c0_g1~~TRINITY_DN30973_c0_g1_i1.p1  ORF type:complete len:278 (+),score=45.56 TRINITY_DN30973_c0_g1_i1:76-834(+)